MPLHPAAPVQADAPHPWVRAILNARIPAALKLLLLVLVAAFAGDKAHSRTLRALRQDWLFSTNANFAEDLDAAGNPYTLRRLLQLRAMLGWLLRGRPNRGMRLSGHRAPALRPPQAARAPPWPTRARNHPESVAKTPRPATATHAPIDFDSITKIPPRHTGYPAPVPRSRPRRSSAPP